MKAKNLLLLSVGMAVLNWIETGRLTAQTFTSLHSFSTLSSLYPDDGWYAVNSDGSFPNSLVLSGNTLYGTAGGGGDWGSGALFAVNTDGSGFTNLHSFALRDLHGFYVPETNPDGVNPNGLILSGNTLYGTAEKGGTGYDSGALFAMNTDGTDFTNLHNFTPRSGLFVGVNNWDGMNPEGSLVLSANALYGAANSGGSFGNGTVFALNVDSTGFTNLHNFTARYTNSIGAWTNRDGANPYAGLISSGNTLYGTTSAGGFGGAGTIFALNTNSLGFTNLHSFAVTHTNSSGVSTNSDGANPYARLLLSGSTLYGTASSGGSGGAGTVFALGTNGTGFKVLHHFTATHNNFYGIATNGDGASPSAGLILSGNTLYGTANGGGTWGGGTIFAINTDGTGFTNLYNFTGSSDGAAPFAELVLSGETLYGTAEHGGSAGNGTVFSLSFDPRLTITSSSIPPSGIILSWPSNIAGFDYSGYLLQSTTNLLSPAAWVTDTTAPVIIAGQNTVTYPLSGAERFFRLKK